jgi:crossover junction endodeoxyribonuclease RuvC
MLLSLDIGFSATGWSLFQGGNLIFCGVIKTEKTRKKNVRVADDNAYRCMQIANDLKEIITSYQVNAVIGELPHGGSENARAASHMGMAVGVIVGVAGAFSLPCEWCTPYDVKKALCGSLKASKQEVMDAVARKYGWMKTKKNKRVTYSIGDLSFPKITFEHVADSIGAYEALRLGNLVKMFG